MYPRIWMKFGFRSMWEEILLFFIVLGYDFVFIDDIVWCERCSLFSITFDFRLLKS